jgi:hypothetical protein
VSESSPPLLRVVRGAPTDEELAALVVVFAGRGTTADQARAERSAWLDRSAALRQPLHPGPGAWRASGLPVR